MDFADIILTCKDCQQEFYFTAGEQQFYRERGFTHVPSRCAICRQARKLRAAGKDPADIQINPASPIPLEPSLINCTKCGKQTTVPFQPEPDRPAYCWECYKANSKSTESLSLTPNLPLGTGISSVSEQVMPGITQENLEPAPATTSLLTASSISQEQLLKILLDKNLSLAERREAALELAEHKLSVLSQVGLMLAVGDPAWVVSWAAVDTLGAAGDSDAAQWLEFKLSTTSDPQFQFILNRAISSIRKRHQNISETAKP